MQLPLINMTYYNPEEIIWDDYDWSDMTDRDTLCEAAPAVCPICGFPFCKCSTDETDYNEEYYEQFRIADLERKLCG
jgi:hypothetical protein